MVRTVPNRRRSSANDEGSSSPSPSSPFSCTRPCAAIAATMRNSRPFETELVGSGSRSRGISSTRIPEYPKVVTTCRVPSRCATRRANGGSGSSIASGPAIVTEVTSTPGRTRRAVAVRLGESSPPDNGITTSGSRMRSATASPSTAWNSAITSRSDLRDGAGDGGCHQTRRRIEGPPRAMLDPDASRWTSANTVRVASVAYPTAKVEAIHASSSPLDTSGCARTASMDDDATIPPRIDAQYTGRIPRASRATSPRPAPGSHRTNA